MGDIVRDIVRDIILDTVGMVLGCDVVGGYFRNSMSTNVSSLICDFRDTMFGNIVRVVYRHAV